METGITAGPSTESIIPNKKNCLKENNKIIFGIFRALGFFPVKWEPSKSTYVVQPGPFVVSYTFWFLWPLLGLGVASVGMKLFNLNENLDKVDDVIETSLFILGFAVAPAIVTYSIKLIAKYIPQILEDISNLCEMDVGFKTPMNIHIPSSKQKALSSKVEFINSQKSQDHEKMLFYVPLVTVFVSIVAFIIAWAFGIYEVVDWATLEQEWPFFIMQFTYLTQPAISNWFCAVFLEWLRLVYEALRVEFDYLYHNTLAYLQETTKPQRGRNCPSVAYSEENVKLTGDYVDKLQEIFVLLSEGVLKFTSSVNFLVCLISAVFCTLELLRSFRLIMYMVPLALAIGNMALFCYKSDCLMNEYERILLILKKTVRLKRRNPDLLPYNELHILRENLLELPPQVVIFGGYRVGNGLLVAAHGFILSYAMLANDILDMHDQLTPPSNATSGV
ncbi:uncharacterized protein LOC135195796 [Macrobrachium nipponense]|uniref:uncharacterized protein LOC135195796 n=1 Tax=Macrobrachium nipponense TaxID=159736 RepID=UPI0030C7DA53